MKKIQRLGEINNQIRKLLYKLGDLDFGNKKKKIIEKIKDLEKSKEGLKC